MKTKTKSLRPPRRRVTLIFDFVPPEWVNGRNGVTVGAWNTETFKAGINKGEEIGFNRGVSEASSYLFNLSGALFQNGKDTEATLVRDFARDILKLKSKSE